MDVLRANCFDLSAGYRCCAASAHCVQYLMTFAGTSSGREQEGEMASQRFLFADAGEFVSDVARISDTLSNLTYLIELDAQNPGLVRQYAKQADQLLQALEDLVNSADAHVL